MIQRHPLTYENALQRAAALCSKCEQCSPDIRKKLSGWGLSASDASRIIERLEQARFIDDSRFAKAYAHDKLAFSGWGRMKIAQGLWAKRLPRHIIDVALESLDKEEYVRIAIKVISSRVRSNPELLDTYENRTKLLRFGVGRGFEMKLIASIITSIKRKRDEE